MVYKYIDQLECNREGGECGREKWVGRGKAATFTNKVNKGFTFNFNS